jgi:trans-aconitate 2-methyltransferase
MRKADWKPEKYLLFQEYREIPARDLIARVLPATLHKIVDLGCGPGNATSLLHSVFPEAEITGFDSSPAMIKKARKNWPDLHFEEVDVTRWTPDSATDLVFSNAMFQWIPNHNLHVQRILREMRTNAVLALQMPDNLREPSHRGMARLASQPRWKDKLGLAGSARSPVLSPAEYHALLVPLAFRVDVWRTIYHHQLASHAAIIDMLSTTGLKPYLDPLTDAEKTEFLESYSQLLEEHYPAMADGSVLFPFPRLFILAIRGDSAAMH